MIDKSMFESKEERCESRTRTLSRFFSAVTIVAMTADHFGFDGGLMMIGLYFYIEGLRHDH